MGTDWYLRWPQWTLPDSLESLQVAFSRFRVLLQKRMFAEDVELIGILSKTHVQGFTRYICGVYYRETEPLMDRPYYQKLLCVSEIEAKFGCDGVYIIWDGD